MAVHKLHDAAIYIAQYDVSTDHNEITVTETADAHDVTPFGDTTHKHLGGLLNVALEGQGFMQYATGAIEDILSAQLGTANVPVTVAADGADAEAEDAWFFRSFFSAVKPLGGAVGDAHAFSYSAAGGKGPTANQTRLVPGKLFVIVGNKTASATVSSQQLGAVTAGQRVYSALHVISVSGTSPTLDVLVRSDDNSGMSSPTTRLTFTQATAATSEIKDAAGAITDDHWDVDYTIGGTDTPTFSFVSVVGIV